MSSSVSPSVRQGLSNVITNVVGGPEAGVYVEAHALEVQAGDCILLYCKALMRPYCLPSRAHARVGARTIRPPHLDEQQNLVDRRGRRE